MSNHCKLCMTGGFVCLATVTVYDERVCVSNHCKLCMTGGLVCLTTINCV